MHIEIVYIFPCKNATIKALKKISGSTQCWRNMWQTITYMPTNNNDKYNTKLVNEKKLLVNL